MKGSDERDKMMIHMGVMMIHPVHGRNTVIATAAEDMEVERLLLGLFSRQQAVW